MRTTAMPHKHKTDPVACYSSRDHLKNIITSFSSPHDSVICPDVD